VKHTTSPGRGLVVYDGPSLLNGDRIVAILTTHTNNRKIGDCPQLWVLHAERSPVDAARVGADAAVCGDCPLRGDGRHRGCYVDLLRGPRSVWDAWRRGRYRDAWSAMPSPTSTDVTPSLVLRRAVAGRVVRLGAYGDPAAVPRAVLAAVVANARGHVGYTHQWRHGFAIADLCMASAETPRDVADASALGFRSFVMTHDTEPRRPGHMICPASPEGGHRLTCDRCGACSGTGAGRATMHVQIATHGSEISTKRYALRVLQDRTVGDGA
jgi:hypothetical protein